MLNYNVYLKFSLIGTKKIKFLNAKKLTGLGNFYLDLNYLNIIQDQLINFLSKLKHGNPSKLSEQTDKKNSITIKPILFCYASKLKIDYDKNFNNKNNFEVNFSQFLQEKTRKIG